MSLKEFLMMIPLSAVIYRIARFLILDDLISEPRDRFHRWLTNHPNFWTVKLQILMLCPFCLTIWISAGVIALYTWVPVPSWAWMWLACATFALVFWTYIDSEDKK